MRCAKIELHGFTTPILDAVLILDALCHAFVDASLACWRVGVRAKFEQISSITFRYFESFREQAVKSYSTPHLFAYFHILLRTPPYRLTASCGSDLADPGFGFSMRHMISPGRGARRPAGTRSPVRVLLHRMQRLLLLLVRVQLPP